MKPTSAAAFSRAWADPTKSRADIGREFGLCKSSVTRRAMGYSLPPRSQGRIPAVKDAASFRAMFLGGYRVEAMADHFGVSVRTIWDESKRLELGPRSRAAVFARDRLLRVAE